MAIKTCVNCDAPLSEDAVFCSECGTYQGQPGVDNRPAMSAPVQPIPDQASLRLCPHCGYEVNAIATACNNCFRSLQPTVRASGPELKPPSRPMVWFLMGGAGVIVAAYLVFYVVMIILQVSLAAHGGR